MASTRLTDVALMDGYQESTRQVVVKLPLAWDAQPESSSASVRTVLSARSKSLTPGVNSQVSSSTSIDDLPASTENAGPKCAVQSTSARTARQQEPRLSSSIASSFSTVANPQLGEASNPESDSDREHVFAHPRRACEIGREHQRHRHQQKRAESQVPLNSSVLGSHSSAPNFRQQNKERNLQGKVKPPSLESDEHHGIAHPFQNRRAWPRVHVNMVEGKGVIVSDAERQPSLIQHHAQLLQTLEASIMTVPPKTRPDQNNEILRRDGKRKITIQKHVMQAGQIALNFFFVFGTWWWTKYYYLFLPFITATVALNVIMVWSVTIAKIKHTIWPERKVIPDVPEALVMVIPCYNETKEELLKSLDSLCDQADIDEHKRTIMIICDGKVRGPGMEKTTADYLLEDILTEKEEKKHLKAAYLAWDQQYMDIVIQRGRYRGLPYFCIVKQQNQGKRDGLIVIRSFLYNFNIRSQNPRVIFSSRFFAEMAAWLLESGINHVDHLLGMDADTSFDKSCVWNLLQESRYPKTVGVCGYVAVDYSQGSWGIWRLYQSAEYTIAQCLRRLHQSTVTKKVSCLPGCCQLLKICEETCGQEVLVERFGYCPSVSDGLLTYIRATASEDRNHVCHMLSARPNAETRQALGARAITDVPHTWSVFLSQRRRWTLGATSNDLLLAFAPGIQWFERILAMVNVITWFLNPFILASVASFVYACFHVDTWIIMAFVSVMLFPVMYYLIIPFWLCRSVREGVQFWAGCACYIFLGPFINISVLVYACWNMDSFGWGKTRKVIAEDTSSSEGPSDTDDALPKQEGGDSEQVSQASPDRVTDLMKAEERLGG